MTECNAVVRVYDSDAAVIIKAVQMSGLAMNKVSIVGKDYYSETAIGYYEAGDRKRVWRQLASFSGGLSNLLMSSAFYFIPGIGPVIVFGPLGSWIVTAIEGGNAINGDLTALAAALGTIGIAPDSIMKCEAALKIDKFIVIAHGVPDEIAKANSILETAFAAPMVAVFRGALGRPRA